MEKFALVSLSDKTGLVPFCKALIDECAYRLVSTGGTAACLKEAGIPVTEVSDYTGFPEMMEGRLKTLHPKVHGGLLCRRDLSQHMAQAQEHSINLIDLLVVNLYPFEETVARQDVTRSEAIEQIDIGGPAMLRSAAKNHAAVTVVYDPADYDRVLAALKEPEQLTQLRRELALKVFQRTSKYDAAIAAYLEQQDDSAPNLEVLAGFPEAFELNLPKQQKLRYGENPHQQAALYGQFFDCCEQLQGKALSYNNIVDTTAAIRLIGEFEAPTVAILKHTNPCGVAIGADLVEAWKQALATDRQAPFGGIIIVNRSVEEDLAREIYSLFCEVIIAPHFSEEARKLFAKKKSLRLLIFKEPQGVEALQTIRSVVGGILVQDADRRPVRMADYKVVSDRQPTTDEWQSLLFGWRVVKHVKSNAIVYAGAERTLGIGAGQMSRVDSSKIAVWKAEQASLSLKGSIVASDAFFPFADGLIAAAQAGASAAIQPGGSVRDKEVIAAANEHNVAMVFTGMRHFAH